MQKPAYLYKYCSAERATQILRDLTFFMTPAGALNDLFEFRSNSLFTEDEGSKYRLFARRLVAEGWYKELRDAEAAARELDDRSVDDTFAVFKAQLLPFLQELREHSGVTCFTAHRNNQRMWATYGVNHSGAVIEFSTAESASDLASHLTPDLYSPYKLPICISEFMDVDGTRNDALLPLLFSVKEYSWRDEDEWRLLLLADTPQPDADRIVPFPRTAVTRVFLGPRMTEENRMRIEQIADAKRPSIPVFSREIDRTDAKEEVLGFERIDSLEQFMYWFGRTSPNSKTTPVSEPERRDREQRTINRMTDTLRGDRPD